MNRDLLVYFLAVALSATALLFGGHGLLRNEIARGRAVGQAFLRARAETLAACLRARGALPSEEVFDAWGRTGPRNVLAAVVDVQGQVRVGTPLPADGRCFGTAAVGGPLKDLQVKVCWPGVENPGQARRRRFACAEGALGGFLVLVLGLGASLLVRAAVRARRAAACQRARAARLSHNLRTPLTAVSICAELASDERLPSEKRQTALTAVTDGAVKLQGALDELLDFLREGTHG